MLIIDWRIYIYRNCAATRWLLVKCQTTACDCPPRNRHRYALIIHVNAPRIACAGQTIPKASARKCWHPCRRIIRRLTVDAPSLGSPSNAVQSAITSLVFGYTICFMQHNINSVNSDMLWFLYAFSPHDDDRKANKFCEYYFCGGGSGRRNYKVDVNVTHSTPLAVCQSNCMARNNSFMSIECIQNSLNQFV